MVALFELITLSLLSLQSTALPSSTSEQIPLKDIIANQVTIQHQNDDHHGHNVKPLLDLHRELIEIESISGNENAVGKYLVRYLKSIGLTVETQDVKIPEATVLSNGADGVEDDIAPWVLYTREEEELEHVQTQQHGERNTPKPRFNIYAYEGKNRDVHTLLTSHIDTVPPFIKYDMFSPSASTPNQNRTISGRGSVDAKGSIAAMLTAYSSLYHDSSSSTSSNNKDNNHDHHSNDLPSIAFLFVVDEEVGGTGMRHASSTLDTSFRSVIFGEPTESTLACGHKGNLGFTISVKGKAAHSGYPWLGVSANELLLKALDGVLSAQLPSSEKYGNTTVNIGKIAGGVAGNVVAQEATALITVRIADGTPSDSRSILTHAIESATKPLLERGGSVDLRFPAKGYGPIDLDCQVDWWEGETMTVNYGTDVPWLEGRHRRYLYGPGSILVAHSDREAITVRGLQEGVEGYRRIVVASAGD